ncbi:MAG: hypothetical protein IJ512_00985 [Ruminococcus sp.]|nr:hypothetical protein [Ruminococcus sp.]
MTEEKEPQFTDDLQEAQLTEECPSAEDTCAEEPAEFYDEEPADAYAQEETEEYYEEMPEDPYPAYQEQPAAFYEEPYQEDKLIPETAPFQISYDMYQEAYKTYQKRFVFPKTRLFQLILLLLAADFGYHGAMNPDKPMYFMLLLVCISLIMILWYNPRKMRRNIMSVIREVQGDAHIFSMDEEKMTFQVIPAECMQETVPEDVQVSPPTAVYYTKDLRVIEKIEFFLICKGKQLFYVLPKYALYDNQAVVVRETLEETIGRRFRSKI